MNIQEIIIEKDGAEIMCQIHELPGYPQFVTLEGRAYAHIGEQHGPRRGHYRDLEAVPVLKVMGVIEPQDESVTPLAH